MARKKADGTSGAHGAEWRTAGTVAEAAAYGRGYERAFDARTAIDDMLATLDSWKAAAPGDWSWQEDAPPIMSIHEEGETDRDLSLRVLAELRAAVEPLPEPIRRLVAQALMAGRGYEAAMTSAFEDFTSAGFSFVLARKSGPRVREATAAALDEIRHACVEKHRSRGLDLTPARKAAVEELRGTDAACELSTLQHLPARRLKRQRKR